MKFLTVITEPKSIFQGTFKAAVNWSKSLKGDMMIISDHSSDALKKVEIENIDYISANYKTGPEYMQSDYDYILCDDSSMKLINLISRLKTKARKILYIYPMRGVYTIGGLNVKNVPNFLDRLKINSSRLLPYRNFLSRYIQLCNSFDYTVTQSHTSSGIVRYYHGIIPDHIAPNPVDRTIFYPRKRTELFEREKQVILYLGSGGIDTNPELLLSIDEYLSHTDYKLVAFGNERRFSNLESGKWININGVKDADLSAIMNESRFTIVPQEDEPLSYVAMESISSGTPVLASFPDDSIIDDKAGLISSPKNFLKLLNYALEKYAPINLVDELDSYSKRFDMNEIGQSLINFLSRNY